MEGNKSEKYIRLCKGVIYIGIEDLGFSGNAKAEKVYLLSGVELMEMAKGDGTVDNCHPNDWGFASMAKALGDEIENILKKEV